MSLMLAVLMLAANAEAPAADPVAEPVREKKICRADPALTGTRMQKKLCLTPSEWDLRSRGKTAGELKTISR